MANFQHPFQQQPFQQQPLPPGWEARYEPTYRRYYFINHATKETSWIDPRTTVQQPRPSPQPQRPSSQPQRPSSQPQRPQQARPSHQGNAGQRQQESIALQNFGQNRSQAPAQQTTHFTEDSTSSKTEAEKQRAIRTLKNEFDIDEMIIQATLEACDYSVSLGRELIRTMGLHDSAVTRSRDHASSSRAGPSSAAAGAEEDRPRQEYVEMKSTNFSAMYQTTEINVDEENAEESVDEELEVEIEEERSSTTSPVAVSRGDIHVTVDSSLGDLLTGESEMQVTLDSDESAIVSSGRSEALENLIHARAPPSVRRDVSHQATATSIANSSSYTPNIAAVVATGHNAGLVQGPDKQLRKTGKAALSGADPSLRHGPNENLLSKDRVHRSKHRVIAVGHNPGLCRGPDKSLNHGPVPKLTAV